jgi:hypothetical protein
LINLILSMRTTNIDRNRSWVTLQGAAMGNGGRGTGARGNASVHSEHLWNMLEDV